MKVKDNNLFTNVADFEQYVEIAKKEVVEEKGLKNINMVYILQQGVNPLEISDKQDDRLLLSLKLKELGVEPHIFYMIKELSEEKVLNKTEKDSVNGEFYNLNRLDIISERAMDRSLKLKFEKFFWSGRGFHKVRIKEKGNLIGAYRYGHVDYFRWTVIFIVVVVQLARFIWILFFPDNFQEVYIENWLKYNNLVLEKLEENLFSSYETLKKNYNDFVEIKDWLFMILKKYFK